MRERERETRVDQYFARSFPSVMTHHSLKLFSQRDSLNQLPFKGTFWRAQESVAGISESFLGSEKNAGLYILLYVVFMPRI